jgi:hypothetical protein
MHPLIIVWMKFMAQKTEGNNNSPTTWTSGNIGAEGIMELDPGPIEDNNSFDSGDPENCGTSTMHYDLVPSQLVLSDQLVPAFQQGHQAFFIVELKDKSTVLMATPTIAFCPWSPFVWTIHLSKTIPFICTQTCLTIPMMCLQAVSIQPSIWGDITSMTSLPMNTALWMKI